MNVQNSKINRILTNSRAFSKQSPQRALTPYTIRTNSFEHTVRQRNSPATNLPGRPPQHRQVFV